VTKLCMILISVVFCNAVKSMAQVSPSDQQLAKSFVLPLKAPEPHDNPSTKAKVDLGRKLFFDPRLSIDGTVSCNSCHNLMASGSDNRPVSVGVKGQRGGRELLQS